MNESTVSEFVLLTFPSYLDQYAVLCALVIIIYIVALMENLALVCVICADARLHTPMYFFLGSMSIFEIFYSLTILPQTIVNLLAKDHTISFTRCITQIFFYVALGNTQIFIVVVMSYDRFIAVCNPLRYYSIMRNTVCMKLLVASCAVAWLLSVEQVCLVCRLSYCGPNKIHHFYCDVGQVVVLAITCDKLFHIYERIFILSALLLFTLPFLLVLASYMCIIGAILRIKSSEERWKAFSSCSSHLVLVVIQYSLLSFIYLRPASTFYLDEDRLLVLVYTLLTPVIIPIIYSLRNRVVKSAFKNLVGKLFLKGTMSNRLK